MENKENQSTYAKSLAMTGTGVLALALLTGCTTAEPEGDATPAETTASEATSDAGTGTPTADGTSSPAGTATASGDDPVFAAIDAIHAQHPDAFVVQVDRDDDDSTYEIEAHLEGEILDFTVTADGSVREDDDRDRDDDDVRQAREATVTAEQAAEAALEGRDGQAIDEMELDEENGTLVWKVDLDRENGDSGDELLVDAKSGEVTQDL